ncbi:hypothetical protein MICA_1508 [Micavibrio aeruginosavorus ARL-13]|uniref:Uncharacterized protein n=1 Tax=Micavibrio aeruginosavorus (strain ARL-13) TaxID=856793 RepID=G2KNH8_MICAA|nr:hypothetical protein MICA_1508 [Micavibrio aeruginosavorus ARL-13]
MAGPGFFSKNPDKPANRLMTLGLARAFFFKKPPYYLTYYKAPANLPPLKD